MQRRKFIKLPGGAAVTWPLAARAQQPQMRRVGALILGNADAEVFQKELRETIELDAKRLELLSELTPTVAVIGALVNTNRPGVEVEERDLLAAARKLGRELVVLRTDDGPSIEAAFATLAKRGINGVLVGADALFNDHRPQVVSLAAHYAMAGVFPWREYVTAGGLVSYGPNLSEGYRLSGLYVGRILKGEKPADLPVIQPTKFELAVNLKTAKTLGLIVPPTLLARADEVIE